MNKGLDLAQATLSLKFIPSNKMTRTNYIALFIIGILVGLGVSIFETGPGYMDADYYYSVGLRIASGSMWDEPFLWNYLNDLDGLPQPIFTYWMPLPAVVVALGARISGLLNFSGARLGFILLGAMIPPITAKLAFSFTPRKWAGLLAGLLAAFPVFYMPYLPTTETFGITMVCAGLIFLIFTKHGEITNHNQLSRSFLIDSFFLGLLSGLLHLTRADGLIWLFIVLWWLIHTIKSSTDDSMDSLEKSKHLWHRTIIVITCIAGYLLVTGPWFVRNISVFNSLLPPGTSRALWITCYDELFTYPATNLTFHHFWSSGIEELIRARFWALGQNLQTVIGVQGFIYLTPLVVYGAWLKRTDLRVRMGFTAWLLILFIMTIVFPYAGARGGFFHSGASLQPLLLALVPVGLLGFIYLGKQFRGWEVIKTRNVFGISLVVLSIILTLIISWQSVIGTDIVKPSWNESYRIYKQVDQALLELDVGKEEIVMVNNPPGYHVSTGRWAIVIPNGDLASALAAGDRYRAAYLLLDKNCPLELKQLYQQPEDRPGIDYLKTVEGVRIFALNSHP